MILKIAIENSLRQEVNPLNFYLVLLISALYEGEKEYGSSGTIEFENFSEFCCCEQENSDRPQQFLFHNIISFE